MDHAINIKSELDKISPQRNFIISKEDDGLVVVYDEATGVMVEITKDQNAGTLLTYPIHRRKLEAKRVLSYGYEKIAKEFYKSLESFRTLKELKEMDRHYLALEAKYFSLEK